MKKIIAGTIIALSFSTSALAADGAAIFKAKCQPCHGPDGKGTAMAPAFAGNQFIKSGTEQQISDVIVKGRSGADKKYTNFAIAMPPQKFSADELKAVVDYLKSLTGK